ncbi:MAG: MATE family efflux transporter [Gammaproteobacteria bacterium]|nr:MATE family efflux transporter [Gammaproteobacteria bacterium]
MSENSHSWRQRLVLLQELLKLGLPIVVSMAALIGLGVTDTFMVGLASTRDLAALAIGTNLYFVSVMLLIGLLSVVAPRVSWKLGAERVEEIAGETHQAMWLGVTVGVLLVMLMLLALPLLGLLGLADEVEQAAGRYLQIICWSLPFVGANTAIRNTLDGLHHTGLNMLISLAVFLLNIVLDYLLVFGKAGFPQMGVSGCAVASVVVVLVQSGLYLLLTHRHRDLSRYKLLHRFEWPEFGTLKTLSILGVPAGLALTLEEGFFSSTALLVAPMGTNHLAAHQIVLNITLVSLIVPIALGQAAAILVGRSIGQRRFLQARHQALFTMLVVAALMSVFGGFIFLNRELLLGVYTVDIQVLGLGMSILAICSIHLFFDGLQIAAGIALKGYQDTLIPALMQIVSYWLIGFPLAYFLSRPTLFGDGLGLDGIWLAMLIAISCASFINVGRLFKVSQRYVQGKRGLLKTGTL